MEISILLMEQIAELFLMILMGYIIVKTGLLKGEDSKVISKIVLYLVIPCVIINAFQVDYTSEKVKELLLVFAASVLLQVILLAAVWGAEKVLKLNEVEATSIYYSNSGNLIVPLVTFILGKEWVLYGCVFMSVQLVFLWTHGKNTISREGKWDWKKIVFNVNMISVFAGVVLFFTKIRLPEIVDQSLSSVGSMIGPASMIVTGMLIAEMNLRNIFENAFRATDEYGKINTYVYETENETVFKVEDNGCGMNQEEIEKIKEPFYRVDKSRSRKQGGTGLGVSLCQKIVEKHDGTLEYSSQKGVGTTVTVRIPLQ